MPVITVSLIFCMFAVFWLDSTRYTIPNWLNGLLIITYPFAVYTAPHQPDWQMALAAFGIALLMGYIIFSFRLMGGGDVKLIAALALWVGFSHLADFVFITALIGGPLSIILWGTRKILPYFPALTKGRTLPRILREGEPVPYGIAIAGAFLIMLWIGKVPLATSPV